MSLIELTSKGALDFFGKRKNTVDQPTNRGQGLYGARLRSDTYDIISGEKESVADTLKITDQHHFDTTYELAAAEGLQRKDGPLTSAGYDTRDNGLVREQIYSSIRQLDQGGLTARDFRTRLAQLGLKMPHEAKRLLTHYESNGRVAFKDFVQAFEPYFQSCTVHNPDTKDSDKRQRPQTAPVMPHHKRRGQTSQAFSGHGDIIAWSEGKHSLKNVEEQKREMLKASRTWQQRQKNYNLHCDILSWDETGEAIEKSRKKKNTALKQKNNIITWEGAPPAPAFTPTKLISAYGQKVHNKPCPYGTERDLLLPNERPDVVGSRRIKLSADNHSSGRWFGNQRPDLVSSIGAFENETPVYRPALKRAQGMKSQKNNIGVGFLVKDDENTRLGRRQPDNRLYVDHFEGSFANPAPQAEEKRKGKRVGYEQQNRFWVNDSVRLTDEGT
eukprot:g8671.t1